MHAIITRFFTYFKRFFTLSAAAGKKPPAARDKQKKRAEKVNKLSLRLQ
jgi:hypothetical protein